MRKLWRKTVEMFWEHPVLWMPYIVAELFTVASTLISGWTSRSIASSLMTHRSVLGGQTASYDPSMAHKALLYTIPIAVSARFFNLCVMTVAFILIARASRAVDIGNSPQFASRLNSLIHRPWQALRFSVAFGILMAAAGSFGTIPTLLFMLPRFPRSAFEPLSWCFITSGVVAVSFLLAPMAMRLIPETQEATLDRTQLRTARVLSMVAAASSTIIGLSYNSVRQGMHAHSAFEAHAVGAIATLILDAPLLLLYISLGLLTNSVTHSEQPRAVPATEPLLPN
jgi:hypothetical protein